MNGLARIEPQLIEAARFGDQRALERLLALSQPDLKRFARRSCATRQDAEDAVQIVLWQLQRRIGTLRVLAAFTSWLFRMIERECKRLFRLTQRTQPLDDQFDIPQDTVPLELRRDLSIAIAALEPVYREVLIMRDVEELTAPEVAARLNISIEATKSRLHRARGMLRDKLTRSGYWSGIINE